MRVRENLFHIAHLRSISSSGPDACSCLACPLPFVTGVMRWLQKRRARRAAHGRLRDV
jgi:hypothetical protein